METNTTPGKGWNVGLWIMQVLVALGFGPSGYGKMMWPLEELLAQVPWASAVPEWLMRFIGVTEVLGAIGLILPALTRIRPGLTNLAAAGLTTIMILAAIFHIARAEYELLPYNVVLGGMAFFIYWGRTKKSPIQPR